ncbi:MULTISPECIES: helix-turn-helix domain-containing protein [Streptomyces]|uniref:Helix-turn-helix domain-containing protein n=2 Tax=Streptomyces TaxID=1883 RepID=A0A3R7IPJ2_9ACTN|nr:MULTISPECIES: helix-turn-helix domain-containing protein [Streptomyces]KNE80440.1 AraC family transcriptional regulator [Streptomyces fradiae]OFA46030.1 AraC family transcriptional regulator [Streptomyces fradiae]PQM21868.1 AraC family transcriptional regulator [Streptomyces xinghaiensis]RKM93300.1 helix-turn-helix domain-containing protein [Streptomyces xinghaiensis]RNC71102.1 helix-turn-helix domain-containing protein [Streptomyces xinghaiensis]
MYEERRSARVPAVVWSRTAGVRQQRVLPDGCTDLIWDGAELFVAGPDTRAHQPDAPPGTRYTALRFPPGTGPAVFGVPAHELRDRRLPLAALRPDAEVRRLTERVAGAADPAEVLERAAAEALRGAGPADPRRTAVVAGLRAGLPVAEVAERAGLGVRGLHRLSLAAFGYGPKTLARILRMNRALDLARSGRPLAETAALAGYCDQAHLTREVRALAGLPPALLLAPPPSG